MGELFVKRAFFKTMATIRIFFIFQIVNLMQYLVASQCSSGFKTVEGVEGRCFYYHQYESPHSAWYSQAQCAGKHAFLYEPQSVEEMRIVEKSIIPKKYQNRNNARYHTGYALIEYETEGIGIQQWIGVNTLKFLNPNMWNKGQPENYDGHKGDDCVIVAWNGAPSTGLDDVGCGHYAPSLICEYEIP